MRTVAHEPDEMSHLAASARCEPDRPYDSGMSGHPSPLALAAEFPAATREQWRELVQRGAAPRPALGPDADVDPEAALTSRTYDGIDIKPLYTADDALSLAARRPARATPPFVRGAHPGGTARDRLGRPRSGTPTPTRRGRTRRR